MIEYNAILFDFDGVLAETMEDLFNAWKKAFYYFSIDIKKEDYFPLEGMNVLEVARTISNKYNKDLNPKEIVELKDKYYLENHNFKFYPGIEDFIEFIKKKNKKIAMVTASSRLKLKKTVPENFLNMFNVIITGNDTINGKPSPDPYLEAIKRLEINEDKCIVVENAPLGIKSAKSAGVFCIAICTTLKKDYLIGADIILNNHDELYSWFKTKL
jgi:beta-phosphoglucomutase